MEAATPTREQDAAAKLRERREAARRARLQDDIAAAERSPNYRKKLTSDERAFLEESPRHKELPYDPDTKSFNVEEAKAALRAEQDGVLEGPVTRAYDASGNSQGADFVDGNGQLWDVKDASGGADTVVRGAAPPGGKPGENVLVDATKLSGTEQSALEKQIASELPPGSGDVKFVPKR